MYESERGVIMFGTYGYFGPSYIFIIIGVIVSWLSNIVLKKILKKYRGVYSSCRLNGSEVAKMILESKGVRGIEIKSCSGRLTDHFDQRNMTIYLSDMTYHSKSLISVCIAAHETGHAIQYVSAYIPMTFRQSLYPVASFGPKLTWPLLIIGGLIPTWISSIGSSMILIGIIGFSFATIFQIVTLPVELDASYRAIKNLKELNLIQRKELKPSKLILLGAALTYIAGIVVSSLHLFRFLVLGKVHTI